MGEEGEAVLLLPPDPVHLRQVFGGLAHALGAVEGLHFGVDEAPAQGGVVHDEVAGGEAPLGLRDGVGGTGHGFHAASDIHLALPGPDGPGRLGHGLQPGAAEAVYRAARHLHGEAGEEEGHAGHVAVVLARLVGAAGVDVLHFLFGDAGAVHEGGEGVGEEVVGAHRGQRPSVLADGGPNRFHDPGFGHGVLLTERSVVA